MAIGLKIRQLAESPVVRMWPYDTDFMLCLLRSLAVLFTRVFRSRRDLLLENLALPQQLVGLKQRHPRPQDPGAHERAEKTAAYRNLPLGRADMPAVLSRLHR